MKTLKIKIQVFLITTITFPIAYLPEKLYLAFGSITGRLFFYLLKKRRIISISNIENAQKHGYLNENIDAKKLALKSFQNLAYFTCETIKLFHRGAKAFVNKWELINRDYLINAYEEAKKNKKGVLLITAHCGNWELSGHAVTYELGINMNIVGRSQDNPTVDILINKLRTISGNNFIFKTGGALSMVRALKNGQILTTLFDQAAIVNNEGKLINFLGRPAMANLAPFRLACKLDATIILALPRRNGSKDIITFYPPMKIEQNDDSIEISHKLAQEAHDLLADFIKKYPDQWLWGHRRWKTKESIAKDPKSF